MSGVVYTQVGRPLTLNTPLGPNHLLPDGFHAWEMISRPYRVTVSARAKRGTEIPFEQILGRPASLRVAAPRRHERYFHGIVGRFTQGGTDNEFTHYRLELVPQLWLLTQKFQSRIFVRKSTVEILKEVLGDIPREMNLGDKYPKREFCAQYQESDFAFVSRLMEEEGIFYYFKHSNSGHTMVLADGPETHPVLPTSIRIRNLSDHDRVDEEAIHELGKTQQIVSGRVHLRDHHFQIPHDPLAADATLGSDLAVGQKTHKLPVGPIPGLEVYEYPGDYARRFDGVDFGGSDQPASLRTMAEDNRRLAKVRSQERAAPAIELAGMGTAHSLTPGYKATFTAADIPSQHLLADGQYIITGVTHSMETGGSYRSNDPKSAFNYTNQFTCIPADVVYRPARETPRPRIDGVQTAVVVGPEGEEIFTDKYGRVKLHFHWDRSSSMDGTNSPWVRVGTPHAGKGFGGVCIPRVGEEVIVSFLDGDPDRPIAVGRVYNEREKTPFKLPDKKMVSGMKSNTYPGGGGFNEMSMDDTKGKERMYIQAQYNQDELVKNDQTSHVMNNRTKTVDVDEKVTVGNNRTAEVKVNEDATVGVNHSHTVGSNHTEKVGSNMSLNVGLMKNEMVGLTSTLTVGAAYAITVGAAMNVAVGLASAEEVGLTKTIIAGTRIDLICGAASISMEASGKITIKGSPVIIDGGAHVDIDAKLIDLN